MSNDAAHLVDEVLPDVPVRQWVLSFSYRIRYLLAYDPKLLCAVRRIFVRSERLAALVPRPRAHQHTYHGVFAPAAPYRDLIVPGPRKATTASATPADCAAAHGSDAERHAKTRRLTWAELLQRVFAIDVLECPHCGERRKLIAMISDRVVVRKILDHLGLPSEPPILARSRVGEEPAFGA